MDIAIQPHPLLSTGVTTTTFRATLGELGTDPELAALLHPDAPAPVERDEGVRQAVRDMLRATGYKPTGRGKPASEYLARAAADGSLGPINIAVDVCNIVSLHSGLPISVVDLDLATAPFHVAPATDGEAYVFNRAGQSIDLAGLLCLYDAQGPCANAVRDSQRTKTHDGTTRTLTIVWGVAGHEQRLQRALDWYSELLSKYL
jgi:DNA/RNA-binding domain of Phe-tRNA-synthetase-like protein